MSDYSTILSKMKQEIVRLTEKISGSMHRPERKFAADLCYGILASGSCLLTNVADALLEQNKKVNTVERLGRHLERGVSDAAEQGYLDMVRSIIPDGEVVVHIDNSDVAKLYGKAFEGLSKVRDGSKSSGSKCVLEKGFYVTEAVALSSAKQPVSVFSEVWSDQSPVFVSGGESTFTFAAMDRCDDLFSSVVYVMDRGYDDNYVMRHVEKASQKYIIRLKTNRCLEVNGKRCSVSELCDTYKGKYSMKLFRHGKRCKVKVSCVNARIPAIDQNIVVVLVYGAKHPLVLATNCTVSGKCDMMRVVTRYFSRWRIEEYFRCKKQSFGFEHFRVRSLKSINALNFWLGVCMMFLASLKERERTNLLYRECIEAAKPIRDHVHFFYYRLADGIAMILSKARSGIREYFKPLKPNQAQVRIRGWRVT